MLGELNLTSANILLSGGANGADTEFGKCATKAKHDVVHWSFDGHKIKSKVNVYQLTTEHLLAADPYLIRANKGLIRSFPTKTDHTNNLLRRNYYQVKWSESVYAVSKFTDDNSMMKVAGGTAWAMQVYADRFLYDQEPWNLCKMYMFDQMSNKWYQWLKIWRPINKPPSPSMVYAGIGTRDLTEQGLEAIKQLYS